MGADRLPRPPVPRGRGLTRAIPPDPITGPSGWGRVWPFAVSVNCPGIPDGSRRVSTVASRATVALLATCLLAGCVAHRRAQYPEHPLFDPYSQVKCAVGLHDWRGAGVETHRCHYCGLVEEVE